MNRPLWRYGVMPVLVVIAAQLLRSLLGDWIGPQSTPVQMFSFLAVFIAAWLGGFWAGLIATPLTVVAAYIGVVIETGGIPVLTVPDYSRVVFFTLVSIVFSVLTESRLRVQRRLAQQRDETNNFSFLVQNASDFIGISDLEFRPFFVNKAGRQLLGLPEVGGLSNITVFDFFFPEDLPFLRGEYFERVMRDGHASAEVRFRHFTTGEPIWVLYNVVRTEDSAGHPTGYATISTNLTERKRAEDLLREVASQKDKALARMHELADTMPQIVFSSGPDGRGDYYNARWRELTLGQVPDGEARTTIHDDDRERSLQAWQTALETGQPLELEYRLRLPAYNREPRWYLARAVPVRDDKANIIRWYGTTTDIHDRKMAEAALAESRERLRAALDASDTGTFRWDIVTNEVDWDENLNRLFGMALGADTRSLPDFMPLIHADDRQRFIDACKRCADEGADFEEEFRVVWPDGTTRWLYDKGRVYTSADGSRYMTGACVDITERHQKEDALRAADRQKDEFIGMLSHEIRNPLAPMLYSVSVLERHLADPVTRRPLEVIGRQVRRMIRIVDDLLDVSRVTQGKISLQRDRLRIAEVVVQAVEASRPLMEAHKHTLRLRNADPSLVVLGDMVRLGQVLENLLVNAAKYTPAGGTVTVTVVQDGDHASITVSDTGVGIAPAMLSKVFELFTQADTSLDRSEGGLGIGLTLVDRLTRLHGGTVEAHSHGLGCGSSFIVKLPLVAPDERTPKSDTGRTSLAPPRTVLVVDDNVDSAETLATLLTMNGHRVHVLHDSRMAVTAARDLMPDVMLLDIGLPGLDGFEVMRQIRNTPGLESLTVVAATGYGREEDRARCFAAGFNDHLTKPLDIADLERVLASVVTPDV